jgi:hypothetical protein
MGDSSAGGEGDHQVIVIVVTDSYTCLLSVPVSISLPYLSVVRCGWREDGENREGGPSGLEFLHHGS